MAGDMLKSRLIKMLDEKKWTDIKFVVGEKPNVEVFEAHRNIISASSPVFQAMCFEELADKESVSIPDITPEAFKVLLKFIYTDSINLTSVEIACAIMYAAEKYMVDNLTSECIKFLVLNVCPNNVHYILEHCYKFQGGKTEIVWKCMEYIHSFLIRPEFVHCSKGIIDLIVDQEFLDIPSEVVLLEACVQWAEEHCKNSGLVPNSDNLRAVLGPAVRKIRFQSMSPQELVGSSGFHKLLTCEEAYRILANSVKPGTFPVPADFSISMKKRNKGMEPKINFTSEPAPDPNLSNPSATIASLSNPSATIASLSSPLATVANLSSPGGRGKHPIDLGFSRGLVIQK